MCKSVYVGTSKDGNADFSDIVRSVAISFSTSIDTERKHHSAERRHFSSAANSAITDTQEQRRVGASLVSLLSDLLSLAFAPFVVSLRPLRSSHDRQRAYLKRHRLPRRSGGVSFSDIVLVRRRQAQVRTHIARAYEPRRRKPRPRPTANHHGQRSHGQGRPPTRTGDRFRPERTTSVRTSKTRWDQRSEPTPSSVRTTGTGLRGL